MRRFVRVLVLCLFVMLTVSGCGAVFERVELQLTLDPQELYSLPKLPAKYTGLNDQINEIIKGGAEYAAPVTGTNIQPVQLRDLNGDGREEALAFFRNAADEKPLKICIYTVDEDTYEQTAVIEGSGTAIYSITYNDLDGDGKTELIVGWRVSTELQVLAIYALRASGPVELLRSDYVKYGIADLNRDERQEVVVLRSVPDTGDGAADYYAWESGNLTSRSGARISMTMAELSQQGRLTRGTLRTGEPAYFVTGVVESSQTITDILTLREGELTNIVLSDATGVSAETAMFRSLYPTDINNDSVTEVPKAEFLPVWEGTDDFYYRIDWNSYDAEGAAETVMRTYHAIEDGWYFRLPENWTDQLMVSRSSGADETAVTFYAREGREGTPEPVLRIAAITGAGRENRAVRGNRFNLIRKAETIYVAELLEANGFWEFGITEDEVRSAFSLIPTEWAESES